MDDELLFHDRSWRRKFRNAFRGIKRGMRSESSFFVHVFAAAAVLAAAIALEAARWEWCLLVLSITGVLVAEMFNTALETLAKAVDERYNRHVRDALDMGSAAVLLAAIGSAAVGGLIFVYRLSMALGWG